MHTITHIMTLIAHSHFTSSSSAAVNAGVARVKSERSSLADVIDLSRVYNLGSTKLLRAETEGDVEIGGLLYAVFHAWEEEKSVEIDPRHLWFTVVAQVAKVIKKDPSTYRHLFSTSTKKETIVLTTSSPDEVDPRRFVELLAGKIASPELLALICTPFPTEPEGCVSFTEAMSTTLLEAASPCFTYLTTRCGLRGILLSGTAGDWEALVERISALQQLLGSTPTLQRLLPSSLARAQMLRDVVLSGVTENNDLIDTCFHTEKKCVSGHIYQASGWIFDFFPSTILVNCGTPVTFAAWKDLDTKRLFYQAYGLTHAFYDEHGVLRPRFSRWTFEVQSPELFDKIAVQ